MFSGWLTLPPLTMQFFKVKAGWVNLDHLMKVEEDGDALILHLVSGSPEVVTDPGDITKLRQGLPLRIKNEPL